MVQHAYFEERQRVAQAAGDGPVGCTWAWVTAGVVVRQDGRGCVERRLSLDARMYFRMPIPSDARFVLLELTHRLSSLVQRPLPLDALAADHAARVNATASLTLTHARAALDEPVTETTVLQPRPARLVPLRKPGETLAGSRAGSRQRTCFHATDAASISASQQDQMVERIGRATQRLAQLHARRKLKEMRLAILAREQERKLATRRRLGSAKPWTVLVSLIGLAVGRPRPFR